MFTKENFRENDEEEEGKRQASHLIPPYLDRTSKDGQVVKARLV